MTGIVSCRSDEPFSPRMAGFEAVSESKKRSRIKNRRRARAGSPDFCPQCGQSGRFSPGVKAGEEKSACGHSVVCSAEKQKNPWGLLPRKETQ